MKTVAHIYTDFPSKFGLPRQAGLVGKLTAHIIFEPEYRNPDALRGLDGYSHIWLVWKFSESVTDKFQPTVRPPRLGGNTKMGVFATRSPYRPNPIALSAVKIERIEFDTPKGPVITVSGADCMDGTPIYDIKPYLSYTDSIADAAGGFAEEVMGYTLQVEIPDALLSSIPREKRDALIDLLSNDPRPSYQDDSERVYGFVFSGFEIKFQVSADILTVKEIIKESDLFL
ncbi:MAG: tRNA (N6-threonylcarbamoyladenosine(37)-N6)-methyltransferase TrmO [Eubacteriales bacterium]|nr:tRNA (N6-threonylcarbamoyladenosine(37)-N6)-methyltransferase TrmO [Eubacteriales bacterium]